MAPKSQSIASQVPNKSRPSLSKVKQVKLGSQTSSSSPAAKRFDPLTAFTKVSTPTSIYEENDLKSQPSLKSKGKGKATVKSPRESEEEDDRLWVDMYEPATEGELAVHVKKVENVRRWLTEAFEGGPSGKLKKYRRILALTGPAGTGKTTTIRVLAREIGFDILEWRSAIGEAFTTSFDDPYGSYSSSSTNPSGDYDADNENLFTKFETFLNRASSCQNVFSVPSSSRSNSKAPSSSQTSQATSQTPQNQSKAPHTTKRHIVLLEDLPNILHTRTQTQFHAALHALVASQPSNPTVPVIIIVSDSGMRGEASDEKMAGGVWGRDKEVVDVRTVLSRELLVGPYVTQIGFNPIAPTLLKKAVQSLLTRHFASSTSKYSASPSKEVLEVIVNSANGDIRSAIMALQFACIVELQPKTRRGKKNGDAGKDGGVRVVMEAVTRREQSLALFHLIGRVLYNKRKGDPPNASATTKDIQRNRELDEKLKDPPKLPVHFQEHARRTSRVDVDLLYADSPIDSSLLSLYLHQNYVQFCDDIDQCEGVAERLSWVDSSGGEAWYQANPHRFHLLTLGTLHELPTPVQRRGQKVFKPEFFDYLQKEKDGWEGVRDVKRWLVDCGLRHDGRAGGWSKAEVPVELGGILKAQEKTEGRPSATRPPPSHQLFSRMWFNLEGELGRGQLLQEGDVDSGERLQEDHLLSEDTRKEEERNGGWLEGDDIEDF